MDAPQRIDPDRARAHIEAVIEAVAADPEEEFVNSFGDPAEITEDMSPDAPPLPHQLHEVWRVADGMSCGSVSIYSSISAGERGRGFATMLPEGLERWQGVAEISSAPVFMDRTDGTIWFNWGTDVRELWERQDELPLQPIAPDIWTFIVCCGMGVWYPADLNDDWIYFLRERGLLYGETESP